MKGTKMLGTVPDAWRQWLFPLLLEIIDEEQWTQACELKKKTG